MENTIVEKKESQELLKVTLKEFRTMFTNLTVHENSALSNKLQDKEKIKAIKESLINDKLINPIKIINNKIFDGYIRYELLNELYNSQLIDDDYIIPVEILNSAPKTIISIASHILNKDISKIQRAAVGVKFYLPAEEIAAQERKNSGHKQTEEEKGQSTEIVAKKVGCNREYVNSIKKLDSVYFDVIYNLIMDGLLSANDIKYFNNLSDQEKIECYNFLKNGKTMGSYRMALQKKLDTENQILENEKFEELNSDSNNKNNESKNDAKESSIKDKENPTAGYTSVLLNKMEDIQDENIKLFLSVDSDCTQQYREALAHITAKNMYNSKSDLYFKFGENLYVLKQAMQANYTKIS